MTDWNSLVKGCDISHFQKRPDFGQLAADGIKFIVIKAWQSGHVDPDFDWNRNEAVQRGMLWLPYAYLTSSDNDPAILNFCKVVDQGSKLPAALDWEQAGVGSPTVERWMDLCEQQLGREGLAYYGLYPPSRVTPRIARWPHWFPEYPKNFTDGPRIPPWDGQVVPTDWHDEWLIWQYTGHGRLSNVASEIDLDVLATSLDVFTAWYDTGQFDQTATSTKPSPPVPLDRVLYLHCTGDDVMLLQRWLQWLGEPVGADGVYGPQTMAAVKEFQTKRGLSADGIAGPQTISAINSTTIGP